MERIARADLVLVLGQPPAVDSAALSGRSKAIPIWTKADACPPSAGEIGDGKIGDCPYFSVSALTGDGMEQLRKAILLALGLADFDPAIPRAFTARQADLLPAAAAAMARGDFLRAAESLRQLLEG